MANVQLIVFVPKRIGLRVKTTSECNSLDYVPYVVNLNNYVLHET